MNTTNGGNGNLALFQTIIPHNILPGQTFTVVVGNLIIPIVCPVNAISGTTISFHVPMQSFQPNLIQPLQFTSNTGNHNVSNVINSNPSFEAIAPTNKSDTVSSAIAASDIGIELSLTGRGNSADNNKNNNNISSSDWASTMLVTELDDTDDKDRTISNTENPGGADIPYSAIISQEPTPQPQDGDNLPANPINNYNCQNMWLVSQILSAIKNLNSPDPFDINSYGFKIKIPICLINIILSSRNLDSARYVPTCCGSIEAIQLPLYIFSSIGIILGICNLVFLLLVYKSEKCRFNFDRMCCGDIMRIHYIFQILLSANALFVLSIRNALQLVSAFSLFLTACGILMSFLDYYKYFNLVRLRFSPSNHGTSLEPERQGRYWGTTVVVSRWCKNNVDNFNKTLGYGIIVLLIIIQISIIFYIHVFSTFLSVEDQIFLPKTYETKNGWTPISQFASFQNCSAYAGFTRSRSVEKSLGGGTIYEFCNSYNRSVDEFWYFDGIVDDDDDDEYDFFISNGNVSACCCQWIYKSHNKWY